MVTRLKRVLDPLLLIILLGVLLIGCSGCDKAKSNVGTSLTETLSVFGVTIPASSIWTVISDGKSDDGTDVVWAYKNPDEYCEEHIYVKTFTHGQTENFETLVIPEFSDYKDLDNKYALETSRQLENGTTVSLYFNDLYDGKKLSNYRALIVGYVPSGEGFTLFFDCDEPSKTAVLTDAVIEEIYNSLDFNPEEAVDWYEIWKSKQTEKPSSSSSPSSSSANNSSSSKSSGGITPSSPTNVTDDDLKGMLVASAQEAVREQLKSPSSAKFPWGFDQYTFKDYGSSSDHWGYTRYLVTGYVDSQNSYGAQIRTKWAAEMDYNKSNETYYVVRVLFE